MAAVSRAQSLRRGGPLPRLWIDSSLSSYRNALCSPSSSLPSAHTSDATTIADTPFSPEVFHVLCMYDFDAEDPDQLSFRKNDVLDVVKREETGWWAAARPGDDRVGWIPSSFVEPISETVAHKLRSSCKETGVRGEMLHNPAGLPSGHHMFVASPATEMSYNWLTESDQAPVIKLFTGSDVKEAASIFSPLVPPHEGIDGLLSDSEISPSGGAGPSKIDMQLPQPAREKVVPTPTRKKSSPKLKPSPISERHSVPVDRHLELKETEHIRSYSDPASTLAVSRHLRRRPVLIDDRSSLSRLTVMFESKSVEELDNFLCSPAMSESLDSLASAGAVKSLPGLLEQSEDDENSMQQVISPCSAAAPVTPESLVDIYHELQRRDDGSVIAGSLRALLKHLADDAVDPAVQRRFQRVFLMTFNTFATSDEVFISLLSRFYMSQPEGSRQQALEPSQRRVLEVFRLWYEEYGMLRDDPHIVHRLVDFLASVRSSYPFAYQAHAMLEHLQRQGVVEPSTFNPPSVRRKKRKASKSDFVRMEPTLVARFLCLYEHRLYARIRPRECLNWIKRGVGDAAPNLSAFLATKDRLAAWVKSSILNVEAFGRKAETLNFWIKVAEACKFLGNLSSMGAIAAGLSDPSVAGLQLLWAQVPRGTHLDSLTLLDSPGNATAYRSLQQSVDGSCVPAIEMYLTDLAQFRDQIPDTVVSSDRSALLINFAKRETWFDTVEAMLRYQVHAYSFEEDQAVADFVETGLASVSDRGLLVSP